MTDADSTAEFKVCTKCKAVKPISGFSLSRRSPSGVRAICRECDARRYAESQREKRERQAAALAERLSATTKICCQCNLEKPKTDFARSSKCIDGYRSQCKACHNANNQAYRVRNPESSRRSSERWKERNKERRNLTIRKWQEENRLRVNELARLRRLRDPDAAREYGRLWCSRPSVRIHRAVRERIRMSLLTGKAGKTFEILGYSLAELMAHLERQFSSKMSWDNYGEWHIDHIVPVSSFAAETQDDPDFRACWALSNLRPLWAHENIRKHARRTHLI